MVLSYPILSLNTGPYGPILSYPGPILSYHIISYPILIPIPKYWSLWSYRIPLLSYPILSYPGPILKLYPILSYHIPSAIPGPILSYPNIMV